MLCRERIFARGWLFIRWLNEKREKREEREERGEFGERGIDSKKIKVGDEGLQGAYRCARMVY